MKLHTNATFICANLMQRTCVDPTKIRYKQVPKNFEGCIDVHCRNPNIGFVTKCEMQGPMRPIMCLGVKHTFTNGGECKG
jgi:hypothetical protein